MKLVAVFSKKWYIMCENEYVWSNSLMYKSKPERCGWGSLKMSGERIFDTLQYANRLKAVGVPEKQAEVQAEMMAEIIDDKLATKNDLEQNKSELKRDLEQIKSELKMDIKGLDLKIETLRTEIKLSEERTNRNIAQMGYKTIFGLGSMIAVGVAVLGFLIKLH